MKRIYDLKKQQQLQNTKTLKKHDVFLFSFYPLYNNEKNTENKATRSNVMIRMLMDLIL